MVKSRRDGCTLSRIALPPISSRPYGTGRPFKSNPGLASWAKFSRPYGTEREMEFPIFQPIGGVEVCALSALCALCVEVCALSALRGAGVG
jgi:hypothetical protein